MKISFVAIAVIILTAASLNLSAQTAKTKNNAKAKAPKQLYIDVHQLELGAVKFADVAEAHKKDLATQNKYGVEFIKYWVDESKGLVYCLSSAKDTSSIIKTHKEAHGLLPSHIYSVTDGQAAALKGSDNLFLDIHYLGAGKVTANDVAEAHKKDLAKQTANNVNFINYWVNEKEGVVMCLSQAKDQASVIKTHEQAHGLLPDVIMQVKQGQ